MKPKDKIAYQDLSIRDELMLRLINGATKGGVQKDRRKEEDKYRARRRVKPDEE